MDGRLDIVKLTVAFWQLRVLERAPKQTDIFVVQLMVQPPQKRWVIAVTSSLCVCARAHTDTHTKASVSFVYELIHSLYSLLSLVYFLKYLYALKYVREIPLLWIVTLMQIQM